MKKIGLDELKEIQLDILDHVSKFCEAKGIRFFLDSGTLLGAIRHKGYIPWDDDIDIGMLRPDYERFIKTFNAENSRYQFYSIENNPKFYYPFGKVLDTETLLYEPDENGLKLSVNIDVFVYDNAPLDKRLLERGYNKRDFYRTLSQLRTIHTRPRGNFIRRSAVYAVRAILKVFPKNFFVKKIVKVAKSFKTETGYIGNFTGYERILCEKTIFDKSIEVEFENKKYPAPIGYDKWLKALYGDYMQLPPEDKRVSHHSFVAFIK